MPRFEDLAAEGQALVEVGGAVVGVDVATQAELDVVDAAKAPLASPALTGTPTVPTAPAGTNTTQAASTAFVTGAVDNATYARRRQYDVRDYMAEDDIGAAINRAIAAAAADAYGFGKPGQVILPPMNEALITEIDPVSGVDIIGSGWGKTVLRPQGRSAAVHFQAPQTTLADVTIANFEIDGSEQHLDGGSYDPSIKGIFIQQLRRVLIDHVYVHDTGATGIGTDHHDACTIRDVVAVGCGRLNGGSNPGGAGIGIGTGVWATEALVVEGCVTRQNGRDGLFFETQTGAFTHGARVLGHVSEENTRHGIGDAGCLGLTVIGGTSRRNGKSGFAAYAGTVADSAPGYKGRVVGLDSVENTEHGFHIDWSVKAPALTFDAWELQTETLNTYTPKDFGYTIQGCNSRGNGQHGVYIQTHETRVLPNAAVRDCDVSYNDEVGINVTGGSAGSTDLTIDGNRVVGNGQDAAAGNRVGIRFGRPSVRARIINNRVGDDQTTPTQQQGFRTTTLQNHTDIVIEGNDFRGNAATNIDHVGNFAGTSFLGLNPGWTVGTGSPESVVKAPIGTVYRRTDGGAGTTMYVKESGAGTTGWVAK